MWPSTSRVRTPTQRFISTGSPAPAVTSPTSSRHNGIGRTFGLLQASNGLPTPDPQWTLPGIANISVNPVNGMDVIITSQTGNVFATSNGGVTWFDIGQASVFGTPGNFSIAMAYGAPDPNAPEGVGNEGNFIYVGTSTGQIYVTQDGGGSGTSNNWINVSTGLDGSQSSSRSSRDPDPRQPRGLRRHQERRVRHRRFDPLGD